jgi:hypothetical protein
MAEPWRLLGLVAAVAAPLVLAALPFGPAPPRPEPKDAAARHGKIAADVRRRRHRC